MSPQQTASERLPPVWQKRGQSIGTFDTLLAAHVLELGLVFVTANSKQFQRSGD